MFNILDLYCKTTINLIEEEINYYRIKICSKNFFDWINRDLYKEALEKCEKKLDEDYRYLDKLLDEERNYQERMKQISLKLKK